MYFYKKNEEMEAEITRIIESLVPKLKEKFPDYIDVFGITGSMARSEGTSNSDIDFAIITKYISPIKQKEVKELIEKEFSECFIQPSALFFSPTIFKRPDLMFFEFVNSGKVLFGELKYHYTPDMIPLWEAIRLMTFRGGGPFFREMAFEKEGIFYSKKFHYAFSKAILGCGEALLIVEGKYKASMEERESNLKKSFLASELLKKYYLLSMDYRRGNKFDIKDKTLLKDAVEIMSDTWNILLAKLSEKSNTPLIMVSAPFPSILITRAYFFFKYLKKGKLKFPIKEPFIQEIIKTLALLRYISKNEYPEQLRAEVVELWQNAERFWLPI